MPGSGGSRGTTRGIVVLDRRASDHRFTPIRNWFTHDERATDQQPWRPRVQQRTLKNRADIAKGRRTRRATADRQRVYELFPLRTVVYPPRTAAASRRRGERSHGRAAAVAEGEEPREAKPGGSERFRYLQSALTERSAEPDGGSRQGPLGGGWRSNLALLKIRSPKSR